MKTREEKYTLSESMACLFARELKDGEIVHAPGVRSAVAVAAIDLARRIHAPNITAHYSEVVNAFAPLSRFTSDYSRLAGCEHILPCVSWSFDRIHRGAIDVFFVGGMQIDKYGNLNLVCIGDWKHPKFRGPGTTGLADVTWAKRGCFVWLNEHSKRVFVEKVDFIAFPGYLNGPGEREKAGVKWGGPCLVVSPLATLDFDPDTKRMRLKSVHRGITVEEVVKNTGFELIIPKDVPQTSPPTEEELHVLRTEVDPHGILRWDLPEG